MAGCGVEIGSENKFYSGKHEVGFNKGLAMDRSKG